MTRELKSMDGNNAAAYVSYAFTEVAGITPSLRRALWPTWWISGPLPTKNIFGTTVKVCEMQSRAVPQVQFTFACCPCADDLRTASQGLLLDPQYVQDGSREMLPSVFHVMRAYGCSAGAQHLRRSFRRHGMPSDPVSPCSPATCRRSWTCLP